MKFTPDAKQLRKIYEFARFEYRDVPARDDARLESDHIVAKAWFLAVQRVLESAGFEIVKKKSE